MNQKGGMFGFGLGLILIAIFNIPIGIYLLNLFFNFIPFTFPFFNIKPWMIFLSGIIVAGQAIFLGNPNKTNFLGDPEMSSIGYIIGIPFIIVGLYFLNYPFQLIKMPLFISNLDSWIFALGGILSLLGIPITLKFTSSTK